MRYRILLRCGIAYSSCVPRPRPGRFLPKLGPSFGTALFLLLEVNRSAGGLQPARGFGQKLGREDAQAIAARKEAPAPFHAAFIEIERAADLDLEGVHVFARPAVKVGR